MSSILRCSNIFVIKELRVREERLERNGVAVYAREEAQVSLKKSDRGESLDARFMVDWHLVALPLIQVSSLTDPIHLFKNWLAQMVILAPFAARMVGDSTEESLWPESDGSNTADWLAGLLSQCPAAYTVIADYLQEVMPDLQSFRDANLGKDT